MSADPRAAGVLHGRSVPADAAMLVQTCGGSAQFPGDLLLPHEANSGLNVCKCEMHLCRKSIRKKKRSMLQQQQQQQQQRRRGPNRLQSAKKHPDFFLDHSRR